MSKTEERKYKSAVVHLMKLGKDRFHPRTYQGAEKNTNTGRGVSLPRTFFVNCSAVAISLPPDLVSCRELLIGVSLGCGPMKAFVNDNIPKRRKNREVRDLVDVIVL
jgi:hypothetical protein